MKIKQRSDDFRVRELLSPDVLSPRGEFRVYRVIKSKHTSFEAARALAQEANVNAGDVTMCGLKDRQGVTLQHMAVRHGPQVSVRTPDLRIETAGFSSEPLDSKSSEGNAFEIVLRGLTMEDLETLRANAHALRASGVVNYFDDQRFGNLRHGQGWIALQLMRGEHEAALRALLISRSPHDDHKARAFKRALDSYWGDWTACRDIAGKFGEHHSLFEHLKRSPQDFAGAFYHLATKLRLIHLYAYQSHLWNRAVAEFVRSRVEPQKRVVLTSVEGPLVYPELDTPLGVDEDASFRLPGPKLADVKDREQFDLLADALAHDQLVPAQFVIEGVSGFQLKGEDRPLLVLPRHLRLRPSRPDALNQGALSIEVRFELPRGAYATLVVRRLLETSAKRSKVVIPRSLAPSGTTRRGPREDSDERSKRDFDGPPRRGRGARGERSAPRGEHMAPRGDDRPSARRPAGGQGRSERVPRSQGAFDAPPSAPRGPRKAPWKAAEGAPRPERDAPPRRRQEREFASRGERQGDRERPRAPRGSRPWSERPPRAQERSSDGARPLPLANWKPKQRSGPGAPERDDRPAHRRPARDDGSRPTRRPAKPRRDKDQES